MKPILTTLLLILAVMYSCHSPNLPVQQTSVNHPDAVEKHPSGIIAHEPASKQPSGEENKQSFIPEKKLTSLQFKDSLAGTPGEEDSAMMKPAKTP